MEGGALRQGLMAEAAEPGERLVGHSCRTPRAVGRSQEPRNLVGGGWLHHCLHQPTLPQRAVQVPHPM